MSGQLVLFGSAKVLPLAVPTFVAYVIGNTVFSPPAFVHFWINDGLGNEHFTIQTKRKALPTHFRCCSRCCDLVFDSIRALQNQVFFVLLKKLFLNLRGHKSQIELGDGVVGQFFAVFSTEKPFSTVSALITQLISYNCFTMLFVRNQMLFFASLS
jgi:hypothetical protein